MKRTAYYFLAPFLIFMLFMAVIPLALLLFRAFDGGVGYFEDVFTDGFAFRLLWRSIWIALVATAICFVIAFPIAYGLTMAGFKRGRTILLLFTLPLWTNLMLRSFSLRQVFQLFGMSYEGLVPLLIAMVYNFLPLMILPIYVVLGNIDKKHIEASRDLGATPLQVFRKTVLPLSIPGIIAGIVLVFVPAVSTMWLSYFFGGRYDMLFGNHLNAMFQQGNFGRGSVLSLILLFVIAVSIFILNRFSKIGNKRGGLW